MNIKHTILAGCLLMMGMASCEMKEELRGNKGDSDAMGVMNLSVQVDAKSNDVVTKADGTQDGGAVDGPAVSAMGYKVEISNAEGVVKTLTYDATKANVELPVGDYTLYAHAPGEPQETEAYYGGRNTMKITQDQVTDVAVVCKMMNTQIQLIYDTELQVSFKSWEVTVTAGTKNKLFEFKGTALEQPKPLFWMMEEGTKEIRVAFKGINQKDKLVTDNRVITKPAGADNMDWTAGDMLAITVKPKPVPETPDGVLGIEINAEITWNDINDSVDAPVEEETTQPDPGPEGPTDPEQPETGAPSITGDCIGKELTYVQESADKPVVSVSMDVPGLIKDLTVQIQTTDGEFESMLADYGLIEGTSLINNTDLESLFDLPKENESSYSFILSDGLLQMLSGSIGTHTFNLTVVDQSGRSRKASFKITIKPAQ